MVNGIINIINIKQLVPKKIRRDHLETHTGWRKSNVLPLWTSTLNKAKDGNLTNMQWSTPNKAVCSANMLGWQNKLRSVSNPFECSKHSYTAIILHYIVIILHLKCVTLYQAKNLTLANISKRMYQSKIQFKSPNRSRYGITAQKWTLPIIMNWML